MDQQLKEKTLKRLNLLGMKKSHLAEKMGIIPVQLSQVLAGSRKMTPEEETKLRLFLGL